MVAFDIDEDEKFLTMVEREGPAGHIDRATEDAENDSAEKEDRSVLGSDMSSCVCVCVCVWMLR
jgi:hypothetical protein